MPVTAADTFADTVPKSPPIISGSTPSTEDAAAACRSSPVIPCGSGSEIDAAREQWSDGSNTLAIGPGEVVVYSRNHVTNRSLEEAGIRIHVIPSAELSRGRGGPRCMSMPLWREDPIQ